MRIVFKEGNAMRSQNMVEEAVSTAVDTAVSVGTQFLESLSPIKR